MITVLRHAKTVCINDAMDYYPDGYIAFENGLILEAGSEEHWHPFPDSEETDMHGDILMPAFINCHTHLGMTAFRSLGDDMPDRLHRFLFPLENECMTEELVYTSSCISIAEMLLSGTASAVDMYYFEDQVIKSAEHMHFRLWAGETLLDAPHCDADGFDKGLKKTEELLKKTGDMTAVVCAPHAPYSVSSDNLKRARDFAASNNIRWSMHVAEMPSENTACREKYGTSPVKYLADNGFLDERLIAAHCLYADAEDFHIMADSGMTIAHCPVSNAKAAKGVAPVSVMEKAGCRITLGTDGPASGNTLDMFTQMKTAVLLQKNLLADRSAMPASDIVKMATKNAGKALGSRTGMLQPGYKADILIISTDDANMIPVHDIYATIVYSAQAQNVKHLFVNGKQVVKNRMLVTGTTIPALRNAFEKAAVRFNREIRERYC